jgi:hypothetical protein
MPEQQKVLSIEDNPQERDLKHQLALQELLSQLGQTLSQLPPSQTLERIVEAAFFLTHAEEALLTLIDPRSAGDDRSVRHPGQLNQPLSRQKLAFGPSVKSLTTLSVPLENGQRTSGALTVKLATASLQENDLAEYEPMLRLLAGYANVALRNLGDVPVSPVPGLAPIVI